MSAPHLEEAVLRRILREELRALLAESSAGDEFLTLSAASKFSQLGISTLRAWIKSGRLPRYGEGRVVRVLRSDVTAALRAKSGEPDVEQQANAILRRL